MSKDLKKYPIEDGDGVPRESGVNLLRLNVKAKKVSHMGKEAFLTTIEFKIIKLLSTHLKKTLSRDEIAKEVWGQNFSAYSNVIDAHIKNLRKKLGTRDIIETVWGSGYRISPNIRTILT